jgi:hypothetical protein
MFLLVTHIATVSFREIFPTDLVFALGKSKLHQTRGIPYNNYLYSNQKYSISSLLNNG